MVQTLKNERLKPMNDENKPADESGQANNVVPLQESDSVQQSPQQGVVSQSVNTSVGITNEKADINQSPPNIPQVTSSTWSAPEITAEKDTSEPGSLFNQNTNSNNNESMPVVKVWSIKGVEYAIMTFMLWAIAIAITWVVVVLINGSAGFVQLSAPLALLIVSLPIFAVFFLRLKKAELADSSLKTESTKRKFSQITQIISFIVVFFSLLAIVATILNAVGGESENAGKAISTGVAFVVVWSALFAYYWFDEHRNNR